MTGCHHHRQQKSGQRCGIGDGRARQRGQQARGDDGDVAEPTADVPDEGECEIDDPSRQTTDIHHLAGKDEQRRGEKRKAVGSVDDVLGQDLRIEHLQLPHQRDAGREQREGDRDAEQHRGDERQEKDGERHALASPPSWAAGARVRPKATPNRSLTRIAAAETLKTTPLP